MADVALISCVVVCTVRSRTSKHETNLEGLVEIFVNGPGHGEHASAQGGFTHITVV